MSFERTHKLISKLFNHADMLKYHYTTAPKTRVSHTARNLIGCIDCVIDLQQDAVPLGTFGRKLKNALKDCVDNTIECQISLHSDGTIIIEGCFHLDKLKEIMLLKMSQSEILEGVKDNG